MKTTMQAASKAPPPGEEAMAAAPSASSSPRRHHHGLSPRQRRLLAASARAKKSAAEAARNTNNHVAAAEEGVANNERRRLAAASSSTNDAAPDDELDDNDERRNSPLSSPHRIIHGVSETVHMNKDETTVHQNDDGEKTSSSCAAGSANANDVSIDDSDLHSAATPSLAVMECMMRGSVGDRIRALNNNEGRDYDDSGHNLKVAQQRLLRPDGDNLLIPRERQVGGQSDIIGEASDQFVEEERVLVSNKGPLHRQSIVGEMGRIVDHCSDSNHEEGGRTTSQVEVESSQPSSLPYQQPRRRHPPTDKVDSCPPTGGRIRRQQQQMTQQQQQQQQQRFPSDEINSWGNDYNNLRYYRITFGGVVALLSEKELSDIGGERRRQRNEQKKTLDDALPPLQQLSLEERDSGNSISGRTNGGSALSSTYYVGYGEIVATSSPEITIPIKVGDVTSDDTGERATSTTTAFARAIRVDSILTGGYYYDETSHNHDTTTINEMATNESSDGQKHFGYLLLTNNANQHSNQQRQQQQRQQAITIAKPLPKSTFTSIQHGPFTYKITSPSPLAVLSGPAVDASTLGVGLLPNTIHEISLRISLQLQTAVQNDDDFDLVDDADPAGTIQFLRLSRRRGWIADRRVDEVDDGKLRVSYLVEDVTTTSMMMNGGNKDGRISSILTSQSTPSLSNISLDETSSLNSSSLTSAANNASFYSSVVASSIATPTSIKARRRRNLRRPSRRTAGAGGGGKGGTERSPQLSTSTLNAATLLAAAGGESFEEAGSSITGIGGDDSYSSSIANNNNSHLLSSRQTLPTTKSYYLMRVVAPLGLKILDAPHFQVSNLIHHSPSNSPVTPASGISPFARTNAMIGSSSLSSPETSPTVSGGGGRKNNRNSPPSGVGGGGGGGPKVRYLARGQIFEASNRMEITTDDVAYTSGQGLIKLSDGSGWAIVPHHRELMEQFRRSGIHEERNIAAYEEIGNATIRQHYHRPSFTLTPTSTPVKQADRSMTDDANNANVVWLRITAPPNGIKVLLPPPQQQQQKLLTTPPKPKPPPPPSDSSSEVAASSVVSSTFFDSVWSRVAVGTPTKERKARDHSTSPMKHKVSNHSPKKLQQQPPMIPVIPCGMVVPVERWEDQNTTTKSFVRLFNGQGWIPRRLGETIYAHEVDTPDIRVGSFWFRVTSPSGLDVRHGPSRHAPIIKSDHNNACFRFECGEYLRASEIMTVGCEKTNLDGGGAATECFAKLYRRSHNSNIHQDGENDNSGDNMSSLLLSRYSSLRSLISPGEWVQVHDSTDDDHNQQQVVFLEECSSAPSIERNRVGWRYVAIVGGGGVQVRRGPSLRANTTGQFIFEGEEFLVSEKCGSDDQEAAASPICWLRLKDGRGWVCNAGADGKAVVVEANGVANNNCNSNAAEQQHSQRMVRRILEKGSHANDML